MSKDLSMKFFLIATILPLGILFLIERQCYFCSSEAKDINIIEPKIANLPIPQINGNTPQEVKDLVSLIFALEKYKLDHRSYPISSGNHRAWDGFLSSYGESKEDWIPGLVPKYISSLPRDPRRLEDGTKQYLYSSNGANYKLIVHSAENCNEIKIRYPAMVDPIRNCFAYGFWTPNAVW